MMQQRPFELIYSPATRQHLAVIERNVYSLIRQEIETQLRFEPMVETENRKPLTRPTEFGAEWEIRFGRKNQLRVFYEVDEELGQVIILAIGVKRGNRLFIGGEEVKL